MAQRFRRQRLFRGFSSIDKINPATEITDLELVKRDILNHFYTSRGERVMRPNFGSIIWDLLFDPFDIATKEAIVADVEDIIAAEPRVEMTGLEVTEFEHGIRVQAELLYTPFNAVDTLDIEFDRRNNIQSSDFEVSEDIRK